MKIDLKTGKIELTLSELGEIVTGRKKAAYINNPNDNPLTDAYNDGVDIMTKYILDWFGNEFDKKQYEEDWHGGGQ